MLDATDSQKLADLFAAYPDIQAVYVFGSTVSGKTHAESDLDLAIEAINDIGNLIIADDSLGMVNWYSDIPKILLENGVIALDMKEKWVRMISFRNILVHEYIEIDRKIVFDVLQNSLGDIEALRRIFAQYL